MTMILPLTERQKSLYEYLLEKSTTTSDFITKEEICKDLSELYPRHTEKNSEHNSSAYHWIRNDVARINDEDECMIIAANRIGYKIANKEEAERYIKRRFNAHFKALKRTWGLQKKAGLDGQMRFGAEAEEIRTILKG